MVPNDERQSDNHSRGVSPVVGAIFVFLFVVVISMIVAFAGVNALDVSQDEAETEHVRLSMQELADSASTVAGQSERTREVTLSTEQRTVDPDAGRIRLEVTNGSGTWSTDHRLGVVRSERDGTTVAYQGGGVWESAAESDSVRVVSPPPVDYRTANAPTLSFPVITVTGESQSGEALQVRSTGSATSLLPPSMLPLDDESTINLTVESEYYRGWGAVLERVIGEHAVTYDHDDSSVTVTLLGPAQTPPADPADRVDGAVVSTTSGTFSKDATIESYNPNGTANGSLGAVRATRTMSSTNDALVRGPLHVDADFRGDENFEVTGETRIAGTATVTNANVYGGRVSVGGDFGSDASDMEPGNDLQGDLRVGGDAGLVSDGLQKVAIGGDLDVGGDADLGREVSVDGTLTAGQSVRLQTDTSTVGGDVVAGDSVTLLAGTVGGDIVAGGDVVIYDSVTFDGKIEAEGDVIFRHQGGYTPSAFTPDRIEAGGDILVEDGVSVRPYNSSALGNSRVAIAGDDVRLSEHGSLRADTYASNGDGGDAVVLRGEFSQIDGDVLVSNAGSVVVENSTADFTCSGAGSTGNTGRITGCIDEQSPPSEQPTIPDREAPATPLEPVIHADRASATEIIENHRDIQDDPDSSPVIYEGKLKPGGTCDTTCELGAGAYDLDQIRVGENRELIFNTTEGDIDIFLTGEFNVLDWGGSNANAGVVRVVGDGRVSIYQAGRQAKIESGGSVVTESGSADQFWLYQRPDPDATTPGFVVGSGGTQTHPSTFTGVFYGYEPHGVKVPYYIDAHSVINGSVIGAADQVTEESVISFDESLLKDDDEAENADDAADVARVAYLRTSSRTVEVGG